MLYEYLPELFIQVNTKRKFCGTYKLQVILVGRLLTASTQNEPQGTPESTLASRVVGATSSTDATVAGRGAALHHQVNPPQLTPPPPSRHLLLNHSEPSATIFSRGPRPRPQCPRPPHFH